eukprot:Seg14146.1 transcript_id=Seg14146.1/GoldUCD/mRNA.D3Y31 product="hypothetical protein" pseudo=true protein_id=Seg14146.1/GoldUCD/D3Y31
MGDQKKTTAKKAAKKTARKTAAKRAKPAPKPAEEKTAAPVAKAAEEKGAPETMVRVVVTSKEVIKINTVSCVDGAEAELPKSQADALIADGKAIAKY